MHYGLAYNQQKLIFLIDKQQPFSSQNNDELITKLVNNYKIPLITKQQKNITIEDFARINDYFKNGYFIFHNKLGQKYLAINNLSVLSMPDIDKELPVVLVKKHDLYEILEQNFSAKNTDKAKYYLESLSYTATAKNINYQKVTTGFITIFIFLFYFTTNFFYLINNFAYLIQNILNFR